MTGWNHERGLVPVCACTWRITRRVLSASVGESGSNGRARAWQSRSLILPALHHTGAAIDVVGPSSCRIASTAGMFCCV